MSKPILKTKTYEVTVDFDSSCVEVEAKNEEEAIDKAIIKMEEHYLEKGEMTQMSFPYVDEVSDG